MGDLRSAVEGLQRGFFRVHGSRSAWYVNEDELLALIPEGAVLVTEEGLAKALYAIWPNDNQWDAQPVWFREKAAAILARLRDDG